MSAIGRAISTLAEPSMPSSHAETGPGGDRARRQAARRVRSAEGIAADAMCGNAGIIVRDQDLSRSA